MHLNLRKNFKILRMSVISHYKSNIRIEWIFSSKTRGHDRLATNFRYSCARNKNLQNWWYWWWRPRPTVLAFGEVFHFAGRRRRYRGLADKQLHAAYHKETSRRDDANGALQRAILTCISTRYVTWSTTQNTVFEDWFSLNFNKHLTVGTEEKIWKNWSTFCVSSSSSSSNSNSR